MSRVTEDTLNEMRNHLTEYINEVSHLNPDFKFKCFNSRCHNHGDRNPSASIVPSSNKTKWKCFACGMGGDIFKAVELYEGISSFYYQVKFVSEKYNIPVHKDNDFEKYTITNYYYRDENNNLLYKVLRKDFKNSKQIYFSRYVNGVWKPGLENVRRVMYNLPKVKECINKDEPFFLVEGEKCAKALEDLGLVATTSCGGASGFSSKYLKGYIDNLQGGRIIIIPDNDEPGYKYAKAVFNALKNHVKSIKVLKLDGLAAKEDVFDWIKRGGTKETLLKLSENACDSIPEYENFPEVSINLIEEDGCYYRPNGEKKICLSNFIISPEYMISSEKQDHLYCTIVPKAGDDFSRVFTPDNFDDLNSFRAVLDSFHVSFTGNLSDLQHIKFQVSSNVKIKRQGVYYSGFHKIKDQWVYVDGLGALDKNLNVREDVVLLEGCEEITSSLSKADLISEEELKSIGPSLFNFNELYVCSTLLGYTCSLFLKGKLKSLKIKHNHLLIEGQSGSGKSSTIENIIIPILGMDNYILNSSDCTPFALTKLLSSSNLFPAILDEYKPSKIDKKILDSISGAMRNSYDFHKTIKGRANLQKNKEFEPISSVILAGEGGIDETANLERSLKIIISSSKHNEKFLKSFNNLKANSKILNKLGKSILKETLKMDDNTLLELYNSIYKDLCSAKITSARVRNSITNCVLGIYLLTNVFNELNLSLEKCTGIKINHIIKSINTGAISDLLDYSNNNKSVLDDTLETINRMAATGCIYEGIHYDIAKANGVDVLRLNYVVFYDNFLKYCKDHNLSQEVLPLTSFKKQLSKSSYCLCYDKPTTFRTGYSDNSRRKTFRVAILDIEKLKEKNLEIDFLINN